jgi:hypothetical protein
VDESDQRVGSGWSVRCLGHLHLRITIIYGLVSMSDQCLFCINLRDVASNELLEPNASEKLD